MSSFAKLSISVLVSISLLILFTASSFTNKEKNKINKEELINYITEEVHYETLYGEQNIDLDSFVDKAMIEALKRNKK